MDRGPRIWSKRLSTTDAQRLERGNPTGEIRFTQAKEYNSRVIDQTTHFRNVVFGGMNWQVVKTTPFFEENVEADFDITILGRSYSRVLTISHKPSGEAGQGNITTSIRWGSLAPVLQQVDISGRMFRLYGPPPGATTPFFIVIE
jgi:hypothetical protein